MKEEKNAELDKVIKKIKRMAGRAFGMFGEGEWEKASKIITQGEELIMNFQGALPKELEGPRCWFLTTKGAIKLHKGYLTLSFEIINDALNLAEKYGIKKHAAFANQNIGSYYGILGDFDKALVYYDRAITLLEKCSNKMDFDTRLLRIHAHSDAMRIAINKGDLELARKYFKRLEDIYEQKPGESLSTPFYKFAKATLLKSSMRARDRIKAEQLCKEVVENDWVTSFTKMGALIGLCQLLLVELRMTGAMEVINEMNPLLEMLIDLAQKSESDLYLIEAYMIQGKLALLTFEIKIAQRVLMQAQRIAEKRGFKGVADEIASLHEDLKGKLGTWEHLKRINAPLSDRIELARLNEHVNGQFRKKIMKMERIAEKEVTVYKDLKTCLVCKGSVGGFNYICPKCNSLYCKECAQAVIEIENACWTCESPIDDSKPVKSYKPEQEEIKVNKKKQKGQKP